MASIDDVFAQTLKDVIENSGITPESDAGSPRRDWVVLQFEWGSIRGRIDSVAYRVRMKLYARIGARVCGHEDPRGEDAGNHVQLHAMIRWADELTSIIEEQRRRRL